MTRYRTYICGGPWELQPDTSDCPNNAQHTPSPRGYVAWHEWAERMRRTHRVTRCRGCGLWTTYVVLKGAKRP